MNLRRGAERLWLLCGICESQVETTGRSLGERQSLAKDFHDGHQVCRTRNPPKPWPGELERTAIHPANADTLVERPQMEKRT